MYPSSVPGTASKKSRRITQDLLTSSAGLTRYSRESTENYLKRVTHLHLQGKRITHISGLEQCSSLKVLYIYDNQIEKIENLDFASKLDQLYLNNNLIREMPQFKLEVLTKVHLEDNDITFVTGLDSCQKLRELYISNQRLPQYMSLEFDEISLQAVANSLEVLDVSGNGISILNQFLSLRKLRKFICDNNAITDIGEMEMMVGMRSLTEVSFTGNKACSIYRYRDKIIAASSDALELLDQIPIQANQKVAIKGLTRHRENLKAARTVNEMDENSHGDETDHFSIQSR